MKSSLISFQLLLSLVEEDVNEAKRSGSVMAENQLRGAAHLDASITWTGVWTSDGVNRRFANNPDDLFPSHIITWSHLNHLIKVCLCACLPACTLVHFVCISPSTDSPATPSSFFSKACPSLIFLALCLAHSSLPHTAVLSLCRHITTFFSHLYCVL